MSLLLPKWLSGVTTDHFDFSLFPVNLGVMVLELVVA